MKPIELSAEARNLLRRRANGEQVEVTPDTLEAYRELATAGVMEPFSGFTRGPEAVFRFTEAGWNMREVLQSADVAVGDAELSHPVLRIRCGNIFPFHRHFACV